MKSKDSPTMSVESNPRRLLNDNEAARMLGIAPASLRNWRVVGRGPQAVKVGHRTVRYRLADVEGYIDGLAEVVVA